MAARTGYPKGDLRREEILATLLTLFGEHGYRSYSLRDLARECSISLAGLMHHFDSKEDLYVQVLRRRDALAAASVGTTDPIAGFLAVITRNQKEPGLIELFVAMSAAAADPDHPAASYLAEHDRRFVDIAVASVPPELTERAAVFTRLLIAVTDGLQRQWLVNRDLDIPAHVAAFLHQFPALRELDLHFENVLHPNG